MRVRLALTLRIDRGWDRASSAEREVQLDSLAEPGDPHPEPDRPIGFRRQEADDD